MKLNKCVILVVLSTLLLLPSCNNHGENNKSQPYVPHYVDIGEEEAWESNDIEVTTDLSEEKVIHTEAQAEYLAYDEEYFSIPESLYPDGQQHISEPLPVTLQWDFDVPEDKELDYFSVYYGKDEDLKDGYEVKGTQEKSLQVYNSYLGTNYFRVLARYTDDTIDCTPIMSYEVENIYPRNLRINGMTNCRDMGGRELEDGGIIRQGLIYRTSSTNGWGNGRAVVPDTITADGKEELLGHLGCKTEINVNNGGNTNYIGIENFEIANMWYDGGKHHLYRNVEPLKKVFHVLADEDNYPVFYHCRIGTDRTGLVAIMISALLGLEENEIYKDYLFSNFGNIQEKRYIGDKAGRDDISKYIADLKTYPGKYLQNKAYNFLLSVGVPKEELDSVINILTEGTKAKGNDNNQVVKMADSFTANGTTLKTNTSNLSHPSAYYTLGNGQSVSTSLEAKASGNATIIAFLGNGNSASTKVNTAISCTVDGSDLGISNDLTYSSVGFGQGDGRTYYTPVMLGRLDVSEGDNLQVSIAGITTTTNNALNIAAISLIYN